MNKIKKTRGKDGKMYYFKNGKRISKSKALRKKKVGGVNMSFRFKDNPVDSQSRKLQGSIVSLNRAFNSLNNKIASQHNKLGKMLKGGKKKKRVTKKKTKKEKKQKGGGSDWMTVVRSRGPANYPGQGLNKFRQFNKNSNYIPNKMLAYYAAPKLSGFEDATIKQPCPYPPGIL